MDETNALEKIIRYQQNKDPLYPFQEHLLMQLCLRVNKKIQDNMEKGLGRYGINYSMYMVLVILFTAENHCLSPTEISRELRFTRTNVTRITDSLEKAGYTERKDNRADRRGKKISLTSRGVFFIKKISFMQAIYLKKIWGSLSGDEREWFAAINKKLLIHLTEGRR
ncbi:MarR family transcriptional regulator [Escherichia coli]|nr:MarR family transcriptional regulator [Escherichia coli]MDD8883359.1 MarR family transcriptional regulator [Escherichia coli]